jgi:hypothetical protein
MSGPSSKTCKQKQITVCKISGFHGGDYDTVLRYSAVQSHRSRPMFQGFGNVRALKLHGTILFYLLLPLALHPFVGFGFLRQAIPSFPIHY